MPHQTLIPWARKLTILSALIALIATVYAFGATTPLEARAGRTSPKRISTIIKNNPRSKNEGIQ